MSNSELLKNSRKEHHSKYLGSKRNKDMSTEKLLGTRNYVNPVTQKDHLPSFDTSNKWSEGYICIAGDSILNRVDGSLPSQKRLVKVRQFLGAAITDMYDHLKTI